MNPKSIIIKYCPALLKPLLSRIENSPIEYRLAKGMFWTLAGAAISRGIMLVAWILIARMLGKTGYGELGMIQATVGMIGVFSGFGLGMTATKHVAEFRDCDPERAGRIIGFSGLVAAVTGGLMALGLLLFAPWIATHTINAPQLADLLRIGSLILFISALTGAQTGSLSGFEAFKSIAYVNFYVGLLSFPILLAGAYFGGLAGTIWALVINLSLNWLFNHLALRKEMAKFNVSFAMKSCTREWPILWKFSLPALLAGALVGPINWLCRAFLANQPDGYGELGVLSAADQWHTMLIYLPSLLSSVILPVLSERLGQKDSEASMKTMVIAIKINALFVFPIAILASIASPYIMSLYGKDFRGGWPTLVIVLLTTGLVAICAPVGQIIAAKGRMWVGLIINMVWAILFAFGTLILIDKGSFGVAIARAGSYVFHTIWVLGFAYCLIRKPKPGAV